MSAIKEDKDLNDKLEQMQLRKKYQSYMEIEEKLSQTTKENRIIEITLKEIKDIEGEAKFYESHGRAYVRKYKKEVVNNLESMHKAKTETIDSLQKTRDKRATEFNVAAKKN